MNEQNPQPRLVNLRGYKVDLQHQALLDEVGATVELRPQALELLCLLANNAGKVMEKQELLTQVWKGLFVTDDSLVQAIGDIRRAIDDQSHQIIRTVPRRGYRLIEHVPGAVAGPDTEPPAENPTEAVPMEQVAEVPDPAPNPALQEAQAAPTDASSDQKWLAGKWVFWLVALLLVAAAAYLVWNKLATATPPPRLSIVVLPFVNASGDASKDYIADSITDDIAVRLSRIKGSFVIGRGTAFTYKNKAVDLKALARDLNVRYVLQGTAGRSENGYHITVQLVDGASGANLWAESLDVSPEKIQEIREWVSVRLSNTLKYELLHADAVQVPKLVNPDSTDLDMQAFSKFRKCSALETCEASYLLFDRVIEMDPNNSTARAHRIMNAVYILLDYKATDRPKLIRQMDSDVQFLEGQGILDSMGHRALARARYFQGRNEEALQQVDETLKIDPNEADALSTKVLYLIINGRAAEAIPVGLKAIEISPLDPDISGTQFFLCHASMHLGKFRDAIEWCERSFASYTGDYWALTDLVAAYTAIGDIERAASAKTKLLKMNPEFSIGFYKGLKLSTNPVWLKEIETNIWANLRKAGIPE
jgi:TolB-like protein/DNA-binding winged helix-turn-helix (wHTH) protein